MKGRTARGQRTLAADYVTSDANWRLELERIFGRCWLLAGHVSELPDSGSYFLHDIGNESVIVLRDGEGRVRAHRNFCRHRGTRLCAETRGRLGPDLRCSYHAWTYGLDGVLKGAPNMQDVAGFDKSRWGLAPAALVEWRGFLFVNLAADAPPFDEAMHPLSGKFGSWPLADLRSAHQTACDVETNWKLVFHNYSECYHCPTAHPHLNRLTHYRNTTNDLDEGPVLGGPMALSNPEGSMSLHGGRCAPPFAGLAPAERSRVHYYTLFPSAFLSLHPDYVLVHRVRPLSVDRTRVVCDWYFHRDAFTTPGFDPQPAVDFWDLTNRQDWELCANAYRGMRASGWTPGPYSELESQLAAFDRHYLEVLHASGPPVPHSPAEGG